MQNNYLNIDEEVQVKAINWRTWCQRQKSRCGMQMWRKTASRPSPYSLCAMSAWDLRRAPRWLSDEIRSCKAAEKELLGHIRRAILLRRDAKKWEESRAYLCGQILESSSDGLRIKSTKALFVLFVGKGGGLASMFQNLFLANPCCSRVPWLPNWGQKTFRLSKFSKNKVREKKIYSQIK